MAQTALRILPWHLAHVRARHHGSQEFAPTRGALEGEAMIRTVYLCGSITKDPLRYIAKFAGAAASLRADGFTVFNPVEMDDPDEAKKALQDPYGPLYESLLQRDLDVIAQDDVDAVVVLPGWVESKGAWREVIHALSLGKPVLEYPNLNPAPVYEERERLRENVTASALPQGSAERKAVPLARGCLDYFPAALAAVAEVSRIGNDKHNPGEPIHHARPKSTDHADCILRHLLDRGDVDPEDGVRHSAKVAWRALALLQEELEEHGAPLARGARV